MSNKKSNYTIYYIIISIVILIIGIIIYKVYFKGNKGNKGNKNKKRVVYAGYWLDNSNIPTIVKNLKNANITHILLTFINHPDNTKPLTGSPYMLDAFKALSPDNQNLLKSNFKIGVSLGGATNVQVPFSNTFISGSYYYNNPEQYAKDYYDLVSTAGLNNYFDLDIEHISTVRDVGQSTIDQCADFIGKVCKKLKDLNPNCEISHAPQPPYFTPQYGNIYTQIYQKYNDYFDFFNIQYYNNGPSDNFEQIFIKSDTNVAPETSILELINKGIDPSYLVVGKAVNGEATGGGYVDLNDMINIIKQAFNTDSLKDWCATGGEMIWYYDTQNLNTQNNKDLLNYFTTISNF